MTGEDSVELDLPFERRTIHKLDGRPLWMTVAPGMGLHPDVALVGLSRTEESECRFGFT